MNEPIRFSLVKPTLDTPFHIDFDWWKQFDNNWRVYLHDCLCGEHQAIFQNYEEDNWIDAVDPVTAEVKRVDGLQHTLMTHCARQPGFLTSNTTLVDAVFRAFLANGNQAMSPKELAAQVSRPAETILRTLAGPHIYKGLRPYKN
jgi:hypothetical protein